MKVAYFVHDLNDVAVHRRIVMLQTGGARVRALGFRRDDLFPEREPPGVPVVEFGRTTSASFGRRVTSILLTLLKLSRWWRHVRGADIFVARNLDMLLLAYLARLVTGPLAPARPGLVYECLDIHPSLIGKTASRRAVRALERYLISRSRAIIVSSPYFVDQYFRPVQRVRTPIIVVENWMGADEQGSRRPSLPPPVGTPWRIGWFGSLRCARSLALMEQVGSIANNVVFDLWGQPAINAVPNFHEVIERCPWIRYHGPYSRSDLSEIYGGVHFSWTIDWSQAGANSKWLLPNRLYEGGAFGAVSIAVQGTAIAAWLSSRQLGVLLGDAERDLLSFLSGVTAEEYERLKKMSLNVPQSALVADVKRCQQVVRALAGDAGAREALNLSAALGPLPEYESPDGQ